MFMRNILPLTSPFNNEIPSQLCGNTGCPRHPPCTLRMQESKEDSEGTTSRKSWRSKSRRIKAECAKSMDIKLYKDSPGILRFKPDKDACKAGPTYVGSTEDGKCHITLVSDDSNDTQASTVFAASVTCDDTGAVYSIGADGNGTMTVVERLQADYGEEEELDPFDELPVEERALLEARFAATNSATAAVSTGGLRGKVTDQLRNIGDRFLAENHHSDTAHRDLQGNIIIDALVLYTADAECGNAGLPLPCVRTPTTEASIRSLINLAIA